MNIYLFKYLSLVIQAYSKTNSEKEERKQAGCKANLI